MNDVRFDVEVEPKLKALEGESFDDISTSIEDEDRVDVQACRLRVQMLQNVFSRHNLQSFQKSCPRDIKNTYKLHESLETLKCKQGILDMGRSTFNPREFACTGGACRSASKSF